MPLVRLPNRFLKRLLTSLWCIHGVYLDLFFTGLLVYCSVLVGCERQTDRQIDKQFRHAHRHTDTYTHRERGIEIVCVCVCVCVCARECV